VSDFGDPGITNGNTSVCCNCFWCCFAHSALPARLIAEFQQEGPRGRLLGFVRISDIVSAEDKYDAAFSKDRFINENDNRAGQDHMEFAGHWVYILVDPGFEGRVYLHHFSANLVTTAWRLGLPALPVVVWDGTEYKHPAAFSPYIRPSDNVYFNETCFCKLLDGSSK
jgi:hypothetical protein